MYSKGILLIKYFIFWLKASNGKGHGVHSPFVFDFIQQVLLKYMDAAPAQIPISIPLFGSNAEKKYRSMISRMMSYYVHHQFQWYIYDADISTFSNAGKNASPASPTEIHIFTGIRTSNVAEKQWLEIKKNEEVTCSIDLFFVGFLFFKKDFKEKLDFMIRF